MLDTEYDDDRALTDYVLTHYVRLASDKERLVLKSILGRTKAENVESPVQSRMLRERWGGINDDSINAELANGPDAYRTSLAARLLRDHAGEIVINRCPQCGRVTRTPLAQQCLWCGEDWHDKSVT